jgi:predicted RNA binding protein YcfA (HicA-like mRNA interferase family)
VRSTKLFRRITSGNYSNVRVRDFRRLVESFGFELDRVSGSHHIFKHPDVDVLLNIQDHEGDAKPYQVRQFVTIVEEYALKAQED